MNVAAIAMSANLFNEKPMTTPTDRISGHAKRYMTPELNSKQLLPPTSMARSTVGDVSKEENSNSDWKEGADEDSNKDNDTGAILYATPTASKVPYWKRRLGWRPNIARVQRDKIKNLFSIRRLATIGFSNAHQGDALLAVSRNKSNQIKSTPIIVGGKEVQQSPRQHMEGEPEKEYVVVNLCGQVKDNGWNAFHAVNHELVFA